LAVRQLKWHASWVQTVVRQVGLYLLQALTLEGSWPLYERIRLNEPLVYRLYYQMKRRVAMFGRDKH
jgi:hypothetical protein